jgi:putative DNA primase/helicase
MQQTESSLNLVLSKLENVRPQGEGFQSRCPSHDDRVASLSIRENPDTGKLLVYCHAGCSFKDIMNALDIHLDSVVAREEVAHYTYNNPQGDILFEVVRFNPKGFQQRRPDGAGGWIWNRDGVKPVLYRVQNILSAKASNSWIFFVEGEKDVETLIRYGLVATTMPGGASAKWQPEYTALLSGAKVAVIPDNDDPGRKYATCVAESLYGYAAALRVITLDVPVHGDVTDWIEAGGNTLALAIKLTEVPDYKPPDVVTRSEMDATVQYVRYLERQIKYLRYPPKVVRKDGR